MLGALPVVVLALVALVTIALVVKAVGARAALDHDEVISHLAASGHLDDWQRVVDGGAPLGSWSSGSDLHRFLQIDDQTTMTEVRRNLADLDYHPPLFFWALSVARTAGLGILWSGPVVNLVAVLLAGLVLYSLLVTALGDRLLAALAVGVFTLSPAVVSSAATARQYPFLMLAGVSLIWVTARLLQTPTSPRLLAGLFAAGVLGLLTAHQFVFALVGALVVLTVRWSRRAPRAVLGVLGAVTGGVAAAWLVHPAFRAQYARLNGYLASLPSVSFDARLRRWSAGFVDFVALDAGSRRIAELVVLVVGVALLAGMVWWYQPFRRVLGQEPVVAASLGIGGIALFGASAAYLLGRAPPHAAGWQYLLLFWPAIVVLGAFAVPAALAVRGSLVRPTIVLLAAAVLMGVAGWRFDDAATQVHASQRRAVAEASRATLVVADCSMRGATPGAAMWVPSDASFLLAPPGRADVPPVPRGADRARPLLFHTPDCEPAVTDIAGMLDTLGFARGARIGWIGPVEVFRLERT